MDCTKAGSPGDRRHVKDCLRLACVLEATARKPGNVHPEAAFEDLTHDDLIAAGGLIAPVLARPSTRGVGRIILDAVESTRSQTGGNPNLGIILLLAPLAAVPAELALADGIDDVLSSLTVADAEAVYQAIRLVNPAGMGEVTEQDVGTQPSVTLLDAMRLAAGRDTIAAQYANGFEAVLKFGLPRLEAVDDFAFHWEAAVIRLHLDLMAEFPDTLIARKCGRATAESAAERAREVLDAGWPDTPAGRERFTEFDGWLRADGHRRNPGTTADLIAACLFAGFRDGRLNRPPMNSGDT